MKNYYMLLFLLFCAVFTNNAQTTVYSVSSNAVDELVISDNGLFLNYDSSDMAEPYSRTNVTITAVITWDAGGGQTEPTNFTPLLLSLQDNSDDSVVFEVSDGLETVESTTDTGAGTSPRTITWRLSKLAVVDAVDAGNKVASTLKSSGGVPDPSVGTVTNITDTPMSIVDSFTSGSISITHINGMTPAAYQLANPALIEGETLTITVNYTSIIGNPNWANEVAYRVRILDVYQATIEGSQRYAQKAATTSTTLIVDTIEFTIPDLENSYSEVRIQAVAFEGEHINGYAGPTWTLNMTADVENDNANSGFIYYSSGKDAIVVDGDKEGSYKIFNMTGGLVQEGEVSEIVEVEGLTGGIYVFVLGDERFKFAK